MSSPPLLTISHLCSFFLEPNTVPWSHNGQEDTPNPCSFLTIPYRAPSIPSFRSWDWAVFSPDPGPLVQATVVRELSGLKGEVIGSSHQEPGESRHVPCVGEKAHVPGGVRNWRDRTC